MAEAAAEAETDEDIVDLEQIHEELNKPETDDAEENEIEAESELTEEEQEAIAEGWKPDGKDKDGNSLSAHEYLSRRPLFQRIKNLNEKIEGLSNTVESLQEHNKVTSAKAIAERTRLMTELKEAKKVAFKDMDIEEAERIDKELETLEADAPEAVTQPKYTQDQWDAQHETFVKENEWYKSNAGLSAAANDFGRAYMQAHPDCSPQDLYKDVIEKIKESFPDSFQTRRKTTSVATNTTRTKPKAKGTKHTFNDIPQEHQAMARVIINSGVKEEDYLQQYFMGE